MNVSTGNEHPSKQEQFSGLAAEDNWGLPTALLPGLGASLKWHDIPLDSPTSMYL
jgi:hypothetical protein